MNILNNLDTFIELIPDLAFFKNMDGVYTHCNSTYLSFVNKNREEIIGKTGFEIHSCENASNIQKIDNEILTSNKTKSFEETFINKDGSITYFHTTKQVLHNHLSEKLGLFCILRDITSEKEYQLIYEDNELLLENIASHDDLSLILNDIVNLAEERNKNTMCSILLLNESKKNLLNGAAPSLPDFYNKAINGIEIGEKVGSCGSAVYKQERVIVEDIDTHENWQPYLALTQKANLHACWSEPIFSSRDEILGSFAIYNNKVKKPSDFELKLISSYAHLASLAIEKENHSKAIKESNERLKELAIKDYLTGLYNRSKLDNSLEYQIKRSKRYESVFGVIMMDIDYFKSVNDKHGHQVGDKVLLEFAKVLTDISRETDIVGRWGGEEFLIIIENADKDGITNLAHKIRETIEMHDFPVVKRKTASLGVTIYNKDEKINELIGRVDKALYKAKNSGRNQVQYL
ncbi:diguanylate cyclase/phosphodiesterase with PAS/PAC domain [Sulfurimonas gotlandica GD1]|uniref:diguanylate cyclase n=1 Tax=Sulfurimonas gotlandica (strain DSM 19862 / JCM 16533 / GD1) TaxID=929558 RepID=B6BNA8_SULGG|nr:diguanylate cyclase [Sulfurimonas gotlandica]EDZ61383.1 diguanylate cyclase/phosphodiesterase with PAS/PAC and GAF sensor [Sulfurimonas gotlandica GD1]EHP30978.1 diguanylate cyclase/phosphodiesterase with PAS/PAC domain [Sulfurimonas gotlandica GD1]